MQHQYLGSNLPQEFQVKGRSSNDKILVPKSMPGHTYLSWVVCTPDMKIVDLRLWTLEMSTFCEWIDEQRDHSEDRHKHSRRPPTVALSAVGPGDDMSLPLSEMGSSSYNTYGTGLLIG